MKTLKYAGPHPAVTVDLPDGGTVTARRGEPVEVPDELAASLRAQPAWKAVKAAEPKAEKAPAKKES